MKVVNHTASVIALPTGHKILPKQIKAMDPEIVSHADNKVLIEQLTRLNKLTIEPALEDPEAVRERIRVAEEAERRRREAGKRRQERAAAPTATTGRERRWMIQRLPLRPSREELCFGTRDAMLALANEHQMDLTKLSALNEEDLRLRVGAYLFNDPDLPRMDTE